MGDISKIALGACLALASGFLTQVYVLKQKELTDRIDELVKLIWEYADVSSKYWSGDFKNEEIGKIEAKMVGMDHFIGASLSNFSAISAFERQEDLERSLVKFSRSTTGGNFQVVNHSAEPMRAADIYTCASQLCIELRDERRKKIGLLKHFFGFLHA